MAPDLRRIAGEGSMSQAPPRDEVWLLTGSRSGEIGQQRALAKALGRPWREMQVARMAPSGKQASFDFSAVAPPWPRLAISFGKTLEAVKCMKAQGAHQTRFVHLGLPRKLAVGELDLIVPMPTDRYVRAPNVFAIRMPLNPPPPPLADDSRAALRLLGAGWPRPWTALIIGGSTTRGDLTPAHVARLAADADAHVLARGGSLLVSTSPRTPAAVAAVLRRTLTAPGELHLFDASSPVDNPYAAYLQMADELVVTGDSASMIAECWRSGRPLWVSPLSTSLRQRWMLRLRSMVPAMLIRSGRVSADVDIGRWVGRLARDRVVGLWGRPEPVRPYRAADDDDLQRLVARIELMLADAGAEVGPKTRSA
ncbi:MAG TPA: ELM1/GtrOC1 family putative glycosyltransferase [Variovorax sp.]|nr:ELM1/GtrOC1 family putative glycosyltransferase [Variovorax sp.]